MPVSSEGLGLQGPRGQGPREGWGRQRRSAHSWGGDEEGGAAAQKAEEGRQDCRWLQGGRQRDRPHQK